MDSAMRRITWWVVVVLAVAKTGSPFPTGYDIQQYQLARAVSDDETSVEQLSVPEEENSRWHETPTVNFLSISDETINKICQDLDVDILIESENKVVECNSIRLQFLPVAENESIENFSNDRLKRDALDEIEGSGGTPLDDILEDAGPKNVSSVQASDHEILKEEKLPSEFTKTVNVTDTDKTKKANTTNKGQEETKNVTSTVKKLSISDSALPVSLFNSSQLANKTVTNATTPNQNATRNATVHHHIVDGDLNSTSHLNVTIKEGPVLHTNHTNVNNTKETPVVKYNNGTNITKERTVENWNRTQIHRKGKHMDIDSLMPLERNSSHNAHFTQGTQNNTMLRESLNPGNSTQAESEAAKADATKKGKGGTTIIWLVFGAVVIAGSAFVAYKYINKRRAKQQPQPAVRINTNDRTQPSNSTVKEQEMRPLMSEVNNVKPTAGDARNASDSQGNDQERSVENGTGDHFSKVGTIRENSEPNTTNVNSHTSEE